MPIFGALQNPTFNPALATIVSISQATNATVQTDFPHTFIVGQYIKFIIPISYGMIQLNNMTIWGGLPLFACVKFIGF